MLSYIPFYSYKKDQSSLWHRHLIKGRRHAMALTAGDDLVAVAVVVIPALVQSINGC